MEKRIIFYHKMSFVELNKEAKKRKNYFANKIAQEKREEKEKVILKGMKGRDAK